MEILHQRVHELFHAMPALLGFEVSPDLRVSGIELAPWAQVAEEEASVGEAIFEALSGVLAEDAAAAELMRGRTFARTLH